jgi:hypothetical protein
MCIVTGVIQSFARPELLSYAATSAGALRLSWGHSRLWGGPPLPRFHRNIDASAMQRTWRAHIAAATASYAMWMQSWNVANEPSVVQDRRPARLRARFVASQAGAVAIRAAGRPFMRSGTVRPPFAPVATGSVRALVAASMATLVQALVPPARQKGLTPHAS